MIVESPARPERRFVRDALPWVVGAVALGIYLVTLNRWVTLSSLGQVTRVSGWDWQPALWQPLLFLLTYPFRWLPESWVPLALNGFAAVCASLTLVILARSVALLPHDRLEQQRRLNKNEHALLSVPNAWVPVALASVALGLQLTFWENAIAGTGEMLDLLLFAYVIRCLLEHRLCRQQSWLDRASLVFGVALANNWAMVGFLPLFVLALPRIRRLTLFKRHASPRADHSGEEGASSGSEASRPLLRVSHTGDSFKVDVGQVAAECRFLLRIALLGLAGLSLILFLPLVQALSPDSGVSLWQALHAVAGSYKTTVQLFGGFLRHHREVALLLAAFSLLPALVLSIRWGAFVLGGSHARADLASLIFHFAHAFLLLTCLWTVLDPAFSPRQISLRFGLGVSFLPLYYLAALSIGYYSGFFLLLFGAEARQRLRRRDTFRRTACQVVPKLVYVFACLTAIGLILKNAPAIRAGSARYLDQYARLATSSLPPDGAVVVSEDPARLAILRAALAREGKAPQYPLMSLPALQYSTYRAWLKRIYPACWPDSQAGLNPPAGQITGTTTNLAADALSLVQMVNLCAQSNRLYCVEPGAGYLLEGFYLQPHGLLQELKFFPGKSLSGPRLSAVALAENQAFWKRAIETGVTPLLPLVAESQLPRPEFEQPLMKLAHLETPPPTQAKILARWYSGALNRWGVTLQRNEWTTEAAPCFRLAQALNSDNLAARVNLQCNSNLLAHQKMTVDRDRSFREQLGAYFARSQVLAGNGPFDEPSYCYYLGLNLIGRRLPRQAGQQFERVKALAPGDSPARLMLGQLFCRGNLPDQALEIATEIRTDPALLPLGPTNEVGVGLLEANAWLLKTNLTKAQGIISSLLTAHPGDTVLLELAREMFLEYGCYSNALQIADQQLQASPDNPFVLVNKGGLFLLTGDFSNAIPLLTRSLAVTNSYPARLNRAYAYLHSGRLDEAKADYQELLRTFPGAYPAYFGLGEIARLNQETNAAIGYYQRYLSNAVAYSEDVQSAAAHLKALQPGQK